MASPEKSNCELPSAANEAEDAPGELERITRQPISTVLILIAMQTEAIPLVHKFQLSEDTDGLFPKGVPWVRYHGKYKDLNINLVWAGKDSLFE